MTRSAQAPQHWEMYNTEAYVADTVIKHSADVVLLQELPGLVPYVPTHSMVGPNPKTHSGNLAILVKHELMTDEPRWATVGSFASTVTLGDLTIANVHLEPGRGADSTRLSQIRQIIEQRPSEGLLIAGDTNTRVSETEAIGELGLKTQRPPRPTWNSKVNKFNQTGAEFSAYFSRWFVSSNLDVTKPWVGDKHDLDVSGKKFFVSDHFACGATVSAAS